jgi:hypothetical protein
MKRKLRERYMVELGRQAHKYKSLRDKPSVSTDASEAVFRFGRDGKPVYIPGPSDSPSVIRQRIAQLQRHLGDDGFGLVTAA